MAIVLQILFFLALLVGLITAGMSVKRWHWSQMLLLVGVVLAATGYSFLAAETLRIHNKLRRNIPGIEQNLAREEARRERIVKGDDEKLGIGYLETALKILTRQRGRVWRGVVPAGQLQDGQIPVGIPQPSPHGLNANAIVYLFEIGEPNARDPQAGARYLGEFSVVSTSPEGALLESVKLLDNRTGERLARSQGPWAIYESMPADSHDLFTDDEGNALPAEVLTEWLPQESVEEYLRHGQPATPDDDEWVRAGYDEDGRAVGPEEADRAVSFRYRRPLRDYGFLFSQLAEDRVVALAKKAALEEDIALLEEANKSAKSLGAFREGQILSYKFDLRNTQKEVAAIQQHLGLVEQQVANAKALVDRLLALNTQLAQQLVDRQLALAAQIDAVAPAP